MKIILASNSSRRYHLLKKLGYPFTVEASNIDEHIDKNLSPYQAIEKLAYEKGKPISDKYNDALVISADTVILFNDEFIGKPKNEVEAVNILKKLSGNEHEVISGVAISYQGKVETFHQVSRVTFKKLDDEMINNYLAYDESLDKAAAYSIQDHGMELVAKVEGDMNNIIGLPIDDLAKVMKKYEDIM